MSKVTEVQTRTRVFPWPGEGGVWISCGGNSRANKGRTEFKAAIVLVCGIAAFLFRGFKLFILDVYGLVGPVSGKVALVA